MPATPRRPTPTPPFPLPGGTGGVRFGAGLAIYVAIVFTVAAIVFAADRSLARRRTAERELDAERAALAVGSFLNTRVGALRALQTIFVGDLPSSEEMDVALNTLEVGEGGFLRVWLVDSVGNVLREASYVRGSGMVTEDGALIDTAASPFIANIARAAAASNAVVFGATRPTSDGGRNIYLAHAVRHGDRIIGFVGGVVDHVTLERRLRAGAPSARSGVVVRAGADTVLNLHARVSRDRRLPLLSHADTVEQRVELSGRTQALGGEWAVEVEHRHRPWAELGLWSVPVAFAVLLGMTFRHERRFMRRLADRSHELETLSSELMRANRSKSEFLANVSHELRTPLNAIVGFTELLREGMYGALSPKQLGPIERIDASASHLRQLVDQILDLAKMTAGRVDVHPETIALRPFVFQVATEIESLVSERGLALSLAVPSTLPRVSTDPTHLRQILLNLLGNAVKFTPEGAITVRGRLVRAEADGGANGATGTSGANAATGVNGVGGSHGTDASRADASHNGAGSPTGSPDPSFPWVALQVVDTGIGIDPADQERIFEEFEQVNAGARSNSMERGTGLGLAVARRMARLLGGDVTVESAVGEGSVFTLWLPVREER